MQKHLKRIANDIFGVLCILAGIAFGWLPGPGGIPLILIGLHILAQNYPAAKHFEDYIQKNGALVLSKIFIKTAFWQTFYDLLALTIFATSIFIFVIATRNLVYSFASALLFFAVGLSLCNRDRYKRFRRRH